jgi:CRP-like cAMP-binding protein
MEVEWLPWLPLRDREAVIALGRPVRFEAGEPLIQSGSSPGCLLLLTAGTARVEVFQDGQTVRVASLMPGDLAGEMSLVTGDPASADVVANEAVEVLRIDQTDLEAWTARDASFGERFHRGLARVIAARLTRSNRRTAGAVVPNELLQDLARGATDVLANIRTLKLRPLAQRFVDRYEEVGHRDAFLWRWAVRGIEATTLSPVQAEWRARTLDTKLLAVILNVLLDDLADNRGSESLLAEALSIPFSPEGAVAPNVPTQDAAYFSVIVDLWRAIMAGCTALPGWERYRLLFEFDYRQVMTAMRYGLLVKLLPALLNPAEHELYPPHNMNMMVFSTIDLMAAPPVAAAELGALREVAWHAQSMGQLSNMIVTWEREIYDRDFSSRIFAIALSRGVLSPDELATLPPEAIAQRVRDAGIEADLLAQWSELRDRIRSRAAKLPSVNVAELLRGLESLLGLTLAARHHL